MRTKVSELKLISSLLLFIASLVFAYFGIFDKAIHNSGTAFGFIIAGIISGRYSFLLFKNSRQGLDTGK